MSTEKEKMLRGELYHAFSPELVEERERCALACHKFNTAANLVERYERITLWNRIVGAPDIPESVDQDTIDNYPWVETPFHADYGYNIKLGANVYINFNCTILDTCLVTIGSRTLVGPNVSLFSATHPVDPGLRNGTKGPELGKPIVIGEDCWLGGNVCVMPGVTIGSGSVVGAGAVVTKDVPPGSVVAGNPARVIKTIGSTVKKPENLQDMVTVAKKKDEEVKALLARLTRLEAEMEWIKERLRGL